jgi:hypothetical protein
MFEQQHNQDHQYYLGKPVFELAEVFYRQNLARRFASVRFVYITHEQFMFQARKSASLAAEIVIHNFNDMGNRIVAQCLARFNGEHRMMHS